MKAFLLEGQLPIDRKWVTRFCLYAVPFGLTLFMAFVFWQGQSIDYVEALGSISLFFLILLLAIKPLSKIFLDFGILKTLASFPKEWGMLMFYFALAHGLSYAPLNLQLSEAIPDYEPPLYIKFGFFALLTASILFITSNKFSMKRLGKNWFRLHKLIYLVLILALLHVYFVSPDENIWVLGVVAFVILLKLLSWKSVEVRLIKSGSK